MINIRQRRNTLVQKGHLLLYLDFLDNIKIIQGNGSPSFSRASQALPDWNVPPALLGNNISRHKPNAGIFIEDANTNRIIKNLGDDGEISGGSETGDIGTYWDCDDTYKLSAVSNSTVNLYGGYSVELENTDAAGDHIFYQAVPAARMAAQTFCISCLVYTGGAPSADDMTLYASTTDPKIDNNAPDASLSATAFDQISENYYKVWATFTGTAADWYIGVKVKANKTLYVNLITALDSIGTFPPTLIPNDTTTNLQRAADGLSIPSSKNITANGNAILQQGTVEFALTSLWDHDDLNSDIYFFKGAPGTDSNVFECYFSQSKIVVRIHNRIVDEAPSPNFSRDTEHKIRITWKVGEKIYLYWDGTKIDESFNPITAAGNAQTTLYIGNANLTKQSSSFIKYFKVWNRRFEL